MKNVKLVTLAGAAICFWTIVSSGHANASMVDDVLTVERLYPDLNTQFQPSVSTTIAVGSSDAINPFGFELIDPEANNISIRWIRSSEYLGDNTIFDGYRFTGFSNIIQNVTATDVFNITVTNLNFGDDFIALNLGSHFDASSSLNLQVQFAPAPVPIPAALPLFLSAIFGMLPFIKRRRFVGQQ